MCMSGGPSFGLETAMGKKRSIRNMARKPPSSPNSEPSATAPRTITAYANNVTRTGQLARVNVAARVNAPRYIATVTCSQSIGFQRGSAA